jgi:hypothetical protein
MRTILGTQTAIPANIDVEYGDAKAACRAFGMGETKLYQAFNDGLIRGLLIKKDRHSARGRRLFSFASIREWMASLEATGIDAARSDAARLAIEARTTRERAKVQAQMSVSPPRAAT